ncbi:MAG: type III pantothenate kinase [Vulcanimicrobiaceae bacterium]
MLLAIDVGNTETKLGVFESAEGPLLYMWRVTTEARRTADEYGVFLTQLFATQKIKTQDVHAVVISSVVPKLDQTIGDACARFVGAKTEFLKSHHQGLMSIRTERPSEVGADLVAMSIGARELYGAPLIVISFGTATAFVAISQDGAFLGTAIAPGIAISVDALVGRAAKLPQIALEAPGTAIGRDTIASLQSGIVYGFVGQTEAIVKRMSQEMQAKPQVIATGGLADVVAKHTQCINKVNANLSLLGLQLFHNASNEKYARVRCAPMWV